jgi:hypothetical protein
LETLKYFPERDIWTIGSMSPKVIIRQNGVLVDKDNKPLDPQIADIKKDIKHLKHQLEKTDISPSKKTDIETQIEELQEQVTQLRNDAKVLIDLSGKLFVFLEPPHPETWNILKPILSHDKYEIEHPYVYQVEGTGFKVKKIVTRGWPACIFCSAKNESKWPEWPEVQSRFLITSPNMIKKKYSEGIKLSAQRKGLPKLAQQYVIISDEQVELANKCVLYLTRQMREYQSNQYNSCPIWIPYYDYISRALPSEKGTDNRVANMILDFINIVALTHGHLRQELQYGNERLVVADIKKDLPEVLRITQNITGLPTFKVQFFRNFIIPAYKQKVAIEQKTTTTTATNRNSNSQQTSLIESSNNDSREVSKELIGLTTREIVDYYRSKASNPSKSINTNNVKETYLDDYIKAGWLECEEMESGKKQYKFIPIIDLETETETEPETEEQQKQFSSSSSSMNRMDENLQASKLFIHKNFNEIPKDWLELQIMALMSYPAVLEKMEYYNSNKQRTCICQFVKEYNTNASITGYFSKPVFNNNSNKIFESMKFIGYIDDEKYKMLSSLPILDQLDYKNGFIYSHKSNITYQQQIIQKQKNFSQNDPTLWKNVLTEFSENHIEESCMPSHEHEHEPAADPDAYWKNGEWRKNLQQHMQATSAVSAAAEAAAKAKLWQEHSDGESQSQSQSKKATREMIK